MFARKKTNPKTKFSSKVRLRWKVFAYIILFAAIVIAVFCFFQIFMLDTFYRKTKTEDVSSILNTVDATLTNYASKKEETNIKLMELATNKEVSIYIVGKPNSQKRTLDVPQALYSCGERSSYLDMIILHYDTILNKATYVKGNFFINFTFKDPVPSFDIGPGVKSNYSNDSYDTDIICGKLISFAGIDNCMLIIDSRLTPVEPAVRTLKNQLLYISIIVVVLSILIAFLVSKLISKPIKNMTDSALLLASGRRDIKFNGKGFKEITELNKSLNYAVEELNKTDTLQKELLANISHDLRTPLTLISGYAELMRDIPDEDNPENLNLIIEETNRLNLLVNDLLSLSRLQAKTENFNIERVNITESVESIVNRFGSFNKNNGFDIEFIHENDYFIQADLHKIEQVIYNFLTNAVNYSGESRKITVIQEAMDEKIKIIVEDYGIGMNQEELSVIWNRYYRVDKGHKRSKMGSGLGLSIVKEILEYHHFEYGVESTEGKGSKFYFIAPIVK